MTNLPSSPLKRSAAGTSVGPLKLCEACDSPAYNTSICGAKSSNPESYTSKQILMPSPAPSSASDTTCSGKSFPILILNPSAGRLEPLPINNRNDISKLLNDSPSAKSCINTLPFCPPLLSVNLRTCLWCRVLPCKLISSLISPLSPSKSSENEATST